MSTRKLAIYWTDINYRHLGKSIAKELSKNIVQLDWIIGMLRTLRAQKREADLGLFVLVQLYPKRFQGKTWDTLWLHLDINGREKDAPLIMELNDPNVSPAHKGEGVNNPPGHAFGVLELEPYKTDLEYCLDIDPGNINAPKDTFECPGGVVTGILRYE
jgi:hypothetical protein